MLSKIKLNAHSVSSSRISQPNSTNSNSQYNISNNNNNKTNIKLRSDSSDQIMVDQDLDESSKQNEEQFDANNNSISVASKCASSNQIHNIARRSINNNINISNNNNSNSNSNSNININVNGNFKSQDELLDIIDIARRGRLSKDEADSLSTYIKLSFRQLSKLSTTLNQEDVTIAKNLTQYKKDYHPLDEELEARESGAIATNQDEDVDLDDEDDHHHVDNDANTESVVADNDEDVDDDDDDDDEWPDGDHAARPVRISEQLLRQHTQQHTNSLVRVASDLATTCNRGHKRARTNLHSPDQNPQILSSQLDQNNTKNRNVQQIDARNIISNNITSTNNINSNDRQQSNYLSNVVERLHQHQQKRESHQQEQQQRHQQELMNMREATLETNQEPQVEPIAEDISYHLQRFLQEQTSLEDLCSSVGIEDNNRLILAAAIHKALVESVGDSNQIRDQAGVDMTNLDEQWRESPALEMNPDSQQPFPSTSGVSTSTLEQQSRANYNNVNKHQLGNNKINHNSNINTQTSLGSLVGGANFEQQQQQQQNNTATRYRRTYNTRNSIISASNSNLVNKSGSTSTASPNQYNRSQLLRHNQAAATLSALASAGGTTISNQTNQGFNGGQRSGVAGLGASLTSSTPIVDFECDTCGSSFDDRHRLMQHQSIHLELKKDWFSETPVDEVMKIFNRRRGEFACNTCNLRFEATFDYDKHNHSEHGSRPYCCQFCGNGTRTFRFWRQYLNHLYDHRYIFSCTIDDCNFTVNRRDSLRFHIFRFHLNCQLPQNGTISGGATGARGGSGGHHLESNIRSSPRNLSIAQMTKWSHGVDSDLDFSKEMGFIE